MKEKIVKDTLLYSFSNFLAKVFGFARSIIVARFLGPSLYGLWNALSIILEYSRYANLGVSNAMNREIPFYRGKKDETAVDQIRNIGFSMACIPSVLIGLTLVLISIFLVKHVSKEWVMALRVIAMLVFTKQLHDFFTLLFRSNNEFVFLSKMQLFFAIIDLALIAVLVMRFGFYGFLWAMVLGYVWLLGYIFLHIRKRYRLRFYLGRKLLAHLVRIGIVLALIVIVVNLRTTVDRLMIIKFLGVTELGYFAISYLLIQFIFLIPSSLSQIMYPRLVEKYGASNKDIKALRNYIETLTSVLAYSMPLLIGMAFISLPFGVRLFLPQYIPGIAAAQVTMLGLFFFSVELVASDFLITTDRLYWYLGCSLIAVFINIILDLVFLKAGLGIKGVALGGIMLTSFLYTTFVLGFVMFNYLKSVSKTFLYILKMYFPFVYTLGILLLLHYSNLHMVNKMIIFPIGYMPLLWILEKKTKTISFVLGVIRNDLRKT